MKIDIRKITKVVGGVATGFGVKSVVDDAIEMNSAAIVPEAPKWQKIMKASFTAIGSMVLSALIADVAQEFVNNNIDKAFDSLNKVLKTKM